MNRPARLLAAAAASLIGLVAFAGPAFASQTGSCAGRTSGMCLWRDDQFIGVQGWFSRTDIPNMGAWNYYDTSTSMNDSVSSARSLDHSCTASMYWDADYGNGPTNGPIVFQPQTQLANFGSYWNDEASSVYWNC